MTSFRGEGSGLQRPEERRKHLSWRCITCSKAILLPSYFEGVSNCTSVTVVCSAKSFFFSKEDLFNLRPCWDFTFLLFIETIVLLPQHVHLCFNFTESISWLAYKQERFKRYVETLELLCFLTIIFNVERCQQEKTSSNDTNKNTDDEAVLQAPETPLDWVIVVGLNNTGDLGNEQCCH